MFFFPKYTQVVPNVDLKDHPPIRPDLVLRYLLLYVQINNKVNGKAQEEYFEKSV